MKVLILRIDAGMILLFPSPSSGEEEYKVPPGRLLNAYFHVVLKGGSFQTDIFSSVDINEWIVLHIFS